MKTIENSNGRKYGVLGTKEKYMLLVDLQQDEYFVIAYNYSEELKTWQNGEYFNSIIEAAAYFKEK